MIDYSLSYGDIEIFLLILMRVASFIYVAPFFGQRSTMPNMVKIGIAVFVSILLYGVVPYNPPQYNTVLGFAIIVLKEVIAGLIIGFGAQITTTIAAFAGQIVDMQTGLSMVSIMDPTSNNQITISGQLYTQVITIMLIISGMYRYLLKALADSYQLIPVNGVVFHADSLTQSMLNFMSNYIIIGFRICLPVFIITFVLNVVLGILAKVAPQLNMFAVGIQIKLLVGLAILFMTCTLMYNAADFIYVNMRNLMNEIIQGMAA